MRQLWRRRQRPETCLAFSCAASWLSTAAIRDQAWSLFALASRGRWGREAAGWARSVARSAFGDLAAEKFHLLRYTVAVALQAEVAKQLLTCMEGVPECS